MISLVENRFEEIKQICCRHGVERLELLVSAAGEGFDVGDSDPDFVVSFGRGIDLVVEGAVGKNSHFAESVAGTRTPLYAT